jgi:hypothetical protein
MTQPEHIVVVIEENHDADQVIGNPNAPYINGTLVKDGLYYSNAHGTDHPSQPNYLELFSGANPGVQGVNSPLQQHYPAGTESTPAAQNALNHGDDYNTGQPFSVPNIGAELLAAGKSFAGYSEDQPSVGFTGVSANGINGNRSYVEKHNAWAQFQGSGVNQLPADTNQPFTTFQAISDFSKLPTVSFVVPNEYNDMHDTVSKNGLYAVGNTGLDKFGAPVNDAGTIQNGDTWLSNNLEAYRQWATTHNSLLITVWDENDYDFSDPNNIPLIIDGDPRLVQPGINSSYVNHFDLLKTLEGDYGLAPTGLAATADGLPSNGKKLIPDPTVQGQHILATAPTGSSAPDSITIGGGSIWVEYGNGANSAGASGSSTIVQYSMIGQVLKTYTVKGLADGLKYDTATGNVWMLLNNDGNSTLQFINPATQQVSGPLKYGSDYVYGPNSSRGFDDVVFDGNRVFLSETNPANPGDPVIVQLLNGQAPFGTLMTTGILSFGDTGTNLVTEQKNQPLPVTDPDSLKLLPNGELLLTGEADGAYIFVKDPGTTNQTESFVTLPKGYVPDDAIMPTSQSGTFYISNQGANDIISVKVTGLNTHDLYADIANKNELVQIDPTTGAITPIVTSLSNPHGLEFVPSVSDTPKLGDPSQLNAASGPTGNHPGKTIAGHENLEIPGAFAETVTFAPDAKGKLTLDHSTKFTGQIKGLTASEMLDLRDIVSGPHTTVGYSGNSTRGTLTVSDGALAAKIGLLGNYLASDFAVKSDGHGGSLVTDAPLGHHALLASPHAT